MNEEFLEQIHPLSPVDFFSLSCPLHRAKGFPLKRTHILPDTSQLLDEESFAEISLAWSPEALLIEASVRKPFESCSYPDYTSGDSLELFIDTRDLKTAGFATKFCHQFLILPQEVESVKSQEITRFRTEDTHPLCDPSDLSVKTEFKRSSYTLQISIPAHCLCGYDPAAFPRLGFTYRLNRPGGAPQHFAPSSRDYPIAQHPALWSSLILM